MPSDESFKVTNIFKKKPTNQADHYSRLQREEIFG